MNLQITSMADIFTIILVFLLKTLSTGISSITTTDVILPEAKAGDEVIETVKVEIAENSILIDGKPTSMLKKFRFDKRDLESNNTSRTLNSALIVEMEKQRQKEKLKKRELASASGVKVDESQAANEDNPAVHLLVLADQKTPYATLKSVLASASNAGVSDFKLMVVEDQ